MRLHNLPFALIASIFNSFLSKYSFGKRIFLQAAFVIIFVSQFSSLTYSQTVVIPDCDVPAPYSDDMFNTDEPCGNGNIITSYDQLLDESKHVDSVWGVPIDSVYNDSLSSTGNQSATSILAVGTNGMDVGEFLNCLDFACSPHWQNTSQQLDLMQQLLADGTLTQDQVDSLYGEVPGSDPGIYQDSLGGSLNDIGPYIASELEDIDVEQILSDEFGIDMGCDSLNSFWSNFDIDYEGDSEEGGGNAFKKKIAKRIENIVEDFLTESEGYGGDPNWFLGEIEGLGSNGQPETMPSPSATNMIKSIQSGVDLYSGTGSLGVPLTSVGSKDISIPVSVNTTPGGTTIDGLESVLGTNMNLNAGGSITRIVKGLPDEFDGNITEYSYGTKRALKPVAEITQMRLGIDANIKPPWLKKLVCKALEKLLYEALNINVGSAPNYNEIDTFLNNLDTLDARDLLQKAKIDSLGPLEKVVHFIKKEYSLYSSESNFGDVGNQGSTEFKIYWTPTEFNYINGRLVIKIPLGPNFQLIIGIGFRVGLKAMDVPSPVVINKRGIGYNRIPQLSSSDLDDLGIDEKLFDVNDEFSNSSAEEKVDYLRNMFPTRKRADKDFFNPNAFWFIEFFELLPDYFDELFNSNGTPSVQKYTTHIDTEPDEYYFNVGGYSGKFYHNHHNEVQIEPYQDLIISSQLNIGNTNVISITTPEGITYTFDEKTYSQVDNYSLTNGFNYTEKEIGREKFVDPHIGKSELPTFRFLQGMPETMEIKKDFITNYHVSKGQEYISAWHLTTVESNMTKERIDLEYEIDSLQYNSNKNWSFSFPNFGANKDSNGEVNYFETKKNRNLNAHIDPSNWRNGFSNLNYTVSESFVKEPRIKSIRNNRETRVEFSYLTDNASMIGAKMCDSIKLYRNDNLYKGWVFGYTTPSYEQISINCDGIDTSIPQLGQGPAYSTPNEFKIEGNVLPNDENNKFIYRFPLVIQVLCLDFFIPIKIKKGIPDFLKSTYFSNTISELGSILHLKDLMRDSYGYPDVMDGYEGDRYQAEHVRNYLYEIKGFGGDENNLFEVASLYYSGDKSTLPKRFSIHQDLWGNYNGQSETMSPFVKQAYDPILSSNGATFNTDHFGFANPDGINFNEGREWEADLSFGIIGQLDSVRMETGAYIKYNYESHDFPSLNSNSNPLGITEGGIRVQSLSKGSDNGETKTTEYKYFTPTVVNAPSFIDQHELNVYSRSKSAIYGDEDLEEIVTTSWNPSNYWLKNKSGYVGYGRVDEVFKDNGRVEHYFTNPTMEDYEPTQPDIKRIYTKYKSIWSFGKPYLDNDATEETIPYYGGFAPLNARNWKLGLEHNTKVYREDEFLLSNTTNVFEFYELGENGVSTNNDFKRLFYFPKPMMYQNLHYGSVNEMSDEAALYQVVDAGVNALPGVAKDILNFLISTFFTKHPYRFIEKDFVFADTYIASEKVEMKSSNTISYFDDGSTNGSSIVNTYDPSDYRRKLEKSSQSIGGKTTETEYYYKDDYDEEDEIGDLTFLDEDVISELPNYGVPIHTISKIGDAIVGGSLTDYFKDGDGRYLAESVWGYREDDLSLTGKFDEYNNDGMPTIYSLAKYGTDYDINLYNFFPKITITWNEHLLMESRGMGGFTTFYDYNDPMGVQHNIFQLRSSTDVNGLITKYDYDDRRRLEVVTNPGELQTVTTDYIMNPLTITTTTDFDDAVTLDQIQIQVMDGWGNPKSLARQPEAATLTTTKYDNLWRPIEQFQLGSGTTTIDYEPSPLGRTVKTTDAVGNITEVEYLGPEIPEGVLEHIPENVFGYSIFEGTKITDPNGHISYGWTEGFGKGTVRVSGEGGVTVTKYDERERVSKIYNPIGEIYEYTYDTQIGQLATKKIPGKAVEKYWYDKSMRMVAKNDGENIILLDYDEIYRLKDIHTGNGLPAGNGLFEEEAVNSFNDKLLLANQYMPQSTWLEQVTEGILKDGGVNGTKTMVYDLDDYGRVNNVTSTYYTDQEFTVEETFTPLTAAGLSEKVRKKVTTPSIVTTMDYQFDFDDILRTTHTRLKLNDPSSPGTYKNIEQLVFNSKDQVSQKMIGATTTSNQYLQTVDYYYDDAGKLIRINDPLENGCVNEMEVCQLYWGSVESNIDFDAESCGLVKGIILDGTLYEFSPPMHPSQTGEMETFINDVLNTHNKQGTAEIHYQSFSGIASDFHISIMKTDVISAKIVFEYCDYGLEPKDCCNIIAIGQDGSFPLSQTYSNSPDLFFEEITYNGMDISLIEMAGSCTAGFIRNHYKYDADHRLRQVQNQLFNPDLIGDALSTSYTYDLAGNIMSLNRNGWVPEGTTPEFMEIDNLTYTYAESEDPTLQAIGGYQTSELTKVEDKIDETNSNYNQYAQPHGFGRLDNISEYTHDGLGRLTHDTGKDLTGISYNLLHLPESISMNNGSIEHQYTFGGEKIKKTGAEGNRFYIGGIEYNDAGLEFISIPNGRVLKGEMYQYNLADHLGNIVVMFEDKSGDGVIQIEEQGGDEVLQRNHYYSFGMRVESPGLINNGEAKNKYLYNGKELNSDFGLDWHYYGFRSYDAAIGRFPSIDPIADNFAFVSGYNYAENRPVDGIDLWGLQYYNMTSRVGVDHNIGGGYDPYININRVERIYSKNLLSKIENRLGGTDKKIHNSELLAYKKSHGKTAWDDDTNGLNAWAKNSYGRGASTRHTLSTAPKGMSAAVLSLGLAMEVIDVVTRNRTVKQFNLIKDNYENMVNSVIIVETAKEMNLIPDGINRVDLINYILDSKVPDNLKTQEERTVFKELGTWLYDNRESILNDKLPESESGDIRDIGYPIDKSENK